MDILNIYNKFYNDLRIDDKFDYSLTRVNDDVMIGVNKENYVTLIIKSRDPKSESISQRTKKLFFACNVLIKYEENAVVKEEVCHIIMCESKISEEIKIFLELSGMLFTKEKMSADKLMDTFYLLSDFFTEREQLSKETAIGLYGELYTLLLFKDKMNIAHMWQNKDMMRFDFSISEKIKLEVKSTTKKERIHSFLHDQLYANGMEIFVISYKFLDDNDGLSLYDLICRCVPLLDKNPNKKARLIKILYDENNESILKNICFSEIYTKNEMRIFNAKDIPSFSEKTPKNVKNAKYDSNCENVKSINFDEAIEYFIEQSR